jgi:hypothetical protein
MECQLQNGEMPIAELWRHSAGAVGGQLATRGGGANRGRRPGGDGFGEFGARGGLPARRPVDPFGEEYPVAR